MVSRQGLGRDKHCGAGLIDLIGGRTKHDLTVFVESIRLWTYLMISHLIAKI